jgi:hypothetical protein
MITKRHNRSGCSILRCTMIAVIMLSIALGVSAQKEGRVKDSIYKKQMGRDRPINAIIKTSPFCPFYSQIPATGEYRLVAEYMLNRNQSMQFGASYLTRSVFLVLYQNMQTNNGSNNNIAMNGYRVQGAYKYYFLNRKFRPEGLYLALHGSFASVKANFRGYQNDYQLLQHFNLNLLIGGQVIIRNRVSIETFMGMGFKNNSYIGRARTGYEVLAFDELPSIYFSHFKISTGINIGIVL